MLIDRQKDSVYTESITTAGEIFMNTKHFDYFIAIAQTGSLSLASKRLGVSQPVLSRYLSNLEQQLGVPLFLWDKRKMHITEAGEIYLNGIFRMKELQIHMLRALSIFKGARSIDLRIGMSPYQGGRELASFYPQLLNRYPLLNLSVSEGNSTDLSEKLFRKELTSIINLYDASLMPGTKIATLIRAELLLVLPNYHPLAIRYLRNSKNPSSILGPVSASQLIQLTDIPFVYLDSNSILGQAADHACLQYGFSPQVLLRTVNSITVSSLLSTGNYGGFLLEHTLSDQKNITCFHLPHPVHLYSGMIFLNDYQPEEAEQYLYYLEYEQARKDTPNLLYTNALGHQFIKYISERIYGDNK